MPDARLPVLWLCGPPGVGKTTVAWELFGRLAGAGITTGYVDIDQLGMYYGAPTGDDLFPEPASDPGRHRQKTRNLGAAVANFRAAGARCLVVSGIVDAVHGADISLLPDAALTLCRLRSDPDDLRRRLAGRARPGDQEQVPEILRYAAALERDDLADACVDTTGRTVAEVLKLVREQAGGWPDLAGRSDRPEPGVDPGPVPGEILLLCGPAGVGKSTVGWQIYEQVRRAGRRAAFADLDQIGFCRPERAGDHRLKAANLAAVWRTYQAAGAQCLVAVGPVEHPDAVRAYRAAFPAARLTLVRLHAGPDQLTERIMLRGRGFGPDVPGDELKGQPAALLRRAADRAVAQAAALESASLGALRVDTTGRPVQDIAAKVLLEAGWPLGSTAGA